MFWGIVISTRGLAVARLQSCCRLRRIKYKYIVDTVKFWQIKYNTIDPGVESLQKEERTALTNAERCPSTGLSVTLSACRETRGTLILYRPSTAATSCRDTAAHGTTDR